MLYTIGEMLIDFMQESELFKPLPGGAPANVAIHARRLGSQSTFIGKLSNDNFGKILADFLEENDVKNPIDTSSKNTALAIVSHSKGERSFRFYRDNTADLDLNDQDIESIEFTNKDILHMCSLGLVNKGTTRKAHLLAIHKIKEAGGLVSFDVNLRAGLWDNLDDAKSISLEVIKQADIIKINEEELQWLSESKDLEEGLKELFIPGKLFIATLGEHGCMVILPNGTLINHPTQAVEPVDTTGAGDSFIATILHQIHDNLIQLETISEALISNYLNNANLIASRVISKHGAVPKICYMFDQL